MASQDVTARIRSRLTELERNQAWLARKLDMDLSTIYRWLTDERPIPRRRLVRIATILDIEPDELLALDEMAEPAAA